LRVDAAVRNAFSLVANCYRIPVARIIELAPFLFVLIAEGSLEKRRRKLDELRTSRCWSRRPSIEFPTLADHADYTSWFVRGCGSSRDKIYRRAGIFSQTIPNEIYCYDEPAYDENKHNPFVLHLKELAASSYGAASIESFGPSFSTSYQVCHEDAIALAGGDEEIAIGLLDSRILIHEIPRDLLKKEAATQLVEWMRSKEAQKAVDEVLRELEERGVKP
jgi:hypothetical protein